MSVGFFGIQFGFALQNGNASRILGIFGAEVEQLSWFWLAAPLTGMIIQPISDITAIVPGLPWEDENPIFYQAPYLLLRR